MKLQLSIFVVVLALCNAYTGDGQPGCRTQQELDIGIFRDHWDATSYWKCETLNEPAMRVGCPEEMGYMDSLKSCVTWEDWAWEKPEAPISEVLEESI